MDSTNTPAAVEKKKDSFGKTMLSVLFFTLILIFAYVLAVSITTGEMVGLPSGPEILDCCSEIIGKGSVKFLSGPFGFWCSLSAIILWFGLWIVSTKRILTAIRGLGLACAIAALVQIISSLITLLLVCVFSMDSILLPFKKILPILFTLTVGKVLIFLLSSMIIAAIAIFIIRLKKLPRKNKKNIAAEAPTSTDAAAPAPAAETSTSTGICPVCGVQNTPDMKFCGGCGAKLD